MTKVRVIQMFRDKDDFARSYPVGSVCDFDRDRAERLVTLGLVEVISKNNTEDRPRRGKNR